MHQHARDGVAPEWPCQLAVKIGGGDAEIAQIALAHLPQGTAVARPPPPEAVEVS
jgi:hypothetical protein